MALTQADGRRAVRRTVRELDTVCIDSVVRSYGENVHLVGESRDGRRGTRRTDGRGGTERVEKRIAPDGGS